MHWGGRPVTLQRFAAIADVHGNRWALEAVLEDIARQDIGEIVNAGDRLFGPLDMAGTADLLTADPYSAVADQLIVNPGSVGLQAYADDAPVPHVMETGSRHARYAILERSKTGWHVEHRAVDYDFEAAALTAERNRRPDWAWRLRTGRAKP